MESKLSLFPLTTETSSDGHLTIGGCDVVELAREFGTPLYIFDELTLRSKCREFRSEFSKYSRDVKVIYASKAFINRAIALLLLEEGLGLDVVSGGELGIARSVDFPMDRVYFHGNNKSAEELRQALAWHIGCIVVDNFYELDLLNEIAAEGKYRPDILLRLSPGVDPHTHQYIATGIIDSKFGFPLVAAEAAVTRAMAMPNLNLVGLHSHIGSLISIAAPYEKAVEVMLGFAAEMKRKHGFKLEELNIGGGFAIRYSMDLPVPSVAFYAEAVISKIVSECNRLHLELPRLVIEPGRAIVGQAGVALYTVGVVKEIPGIRCYVSVDGGMADNIRPALYEARYEAVVADKLKEREEKRVTIAGKYCESGDIVVKDIVLPPVTAGNLIAIPDCGAYCLPMASNYNASLKAAVVLVGEGKARLIRRRETLADLTDCDLV